MLARGVLMTLGMEPTPLELSLIEACERLEVLPHEEPSPDLASFAADLSAALEFEAQLVTMQDAP